MLNCVDVTNGVISLLAHSEGAGLPVVAEVPAREKKPSFQGDFGIAESFFKIRLVATQQAATDQRIIGRAIPKLRKIFN